MSSRTSKKTNKKGQHMSAADTEAFNEFVDPIAVPSHREIMRAIAALSDTVSRVENVGNANSAALAAVRDTQAKQSTLLASLVAWKNSIKAVSAQ